MVIKLLEYLAFLERSHFFFYFQTTIPRDKINILIYTLSNERKL